MITPALPRWVASVLAHPVTGVNALLPSVPRQDGEAQPPYVRVVNAMDDAEVARAVDDQAADPGLFDIAVRLGEEMEMEGDTGASSEDGDQCLVIVHLQGVATESRNHVLQVDVSRIGRCVRRSLRHAFRQLGMMPLVLEGQRITPPKTFTLRSLDPENGTADQFMVLPFTMFDTWANQPIPES